MGYYLTNGIYPSWATFVKTIPVPQDHKRQHFASTQEAARKDVEHSFGVHQARFAIMRRPACFFHLETLKDIMLACIILHNMIVEDVQHTYLGANDFDYDQIDDNGPEPCHIIPLVTLCSSLNVIIPLEIEEFILNFKWITSSIYGNYKASHRNLEF